MTDLSQIILDKYQMRKTKKQKLSFISLLKSHFPTLQVQEGGFPKSRNLIIGDVEKAQVILTAHYDTCAWLPFPNFIAPKNPVLSILYSVFICIPMIAVMFLGNYLLRNITDDFSLRYAFSMLVCFGFVALLFLGPANRHTANDNTSGVIVLCELLCTLTEDQKDKVAFVFFDNEELGLLGSLLFRKKYKKTIVNKLVVNFDCVSDGDYILVAATKAARKDMRETITRSFLPAGQKSILQCRAETVFYPSDQANFPKSVAIAALHKRPLLGYCMGRIHTHRDTVFDKTNITFLCRCVLRLLKKIS